MPDARPSRLWPFAASGEIIEVNEELDRNPELVNTDPYGDGWMIKVAVSDASEMDRLLSADEYEKLIK